jgi:hypothetical protein
MRHKVKMLRVQTLRIDTNPAAQSHPPPCPETRSVGRSPPRRPSPTWSLTSLMGLITPMRLVTPSARTITTDKEPTPSHLGA